jgi:HD-GYP domain-containing protein (c-di-GMP phosphodiesterase class II)
MWERLFCSERISWVIAAGKPLPRKHQRGNNHEWPAEGEVRPMKTYPLRVFVKRVLLIRLSAAALVLVLITGAITYFVQRDRVEQRVVDIGRQGAAALVNRVMDTAEQQQIKPVEALHQILAAHAGSPATHRSGRFVLVQFYSRSGTVFAEASAPEPQAVETGKTLAENRPFIFPDTDQVDAETHHIRGRLFVYTAMPLTDRHGSIKGYARGIFDVSAEAMADMNNVVLRSVLIVVAIVCGVTAILYPVILRLTRRLADYSTNLLDANLETLAVLGSAVAKRDADTDAHNYRVSLYAARLGEKVGLGVEDMRGLIKGSFIHDVGKIGIPDAILLKPGRLNEEEYRVMQTHVGLGVDIVRRASWLRDSVPVVAGHHEKFGGGGYPRGARAENIPLAARIFAIADVFDALTSERPYKKPLLFEDTMKILEQGREVHFDPKLLDAFAVIAPGLHQRYAGREGDDLRQELVAVVDRYFSAGMESLHYGEAEAGTPTRRATPIQGASIN